MADWKTTSEAGFNFEDFCLSEINQKVNPLAYKNLIKGDFSYYDIILFDGNFAEGHKQKTIECKFDEMAAISQNICIEVGCNGRWSGLLITKADFWLIGDGIEIFLIKKEDISRCITENTYNIQYRRKERVKQEDGVVKEMDLYLIPKRIFVNYCLEFGNINEMKYDKLQ